MLEDNVLREAGGNNEAVMLKARHLATENSNLRQTVKDFETQLISLRAVNQELQRASGKSVQILIEQLSRQNLSLESSLFRLIRTNEELSCDSLMKDQLMVENEIEHREMVTNYENKIYELRVGLQGKESFIANMEQKFLISKEDTYSAPSKASLTQFNEMHETKLLLERYMVEHSELQLLLLSKNEDVERLNQRLRLCEDALRKKEEWQAYSKTASTTSQVEKTAKSRESRIRIEQELSRYESRHRHITFSWSSSRKNDLSNQIYELRLFVTKIYAEKWNADQQRLKLTGSLASRQEELREMRDSFKGMEKELQLKNVEVDFYRANFKELAKVSTERKIRFYDEHYPEHLPQLHRQLHERARLLEYWRCWYRKNLEKWSVLERRVLGRRAGKARRDGRSNSCGNLRFSHREKKFRRTIDYSMRESDIFRFIGGEYEANNTMLGSTFEAPLEQGREDRYFEEDEISVIIKPRKSSQSGWSKEKTRPFSKKECEMGENV